MSKIEIDKSVSVKSENLNEQNWIEIKGQKYYELIPKVEDKSTEESPEEILSRCNKIFLSDDIWVESDDDLDNDEDTLLEIIPKPEPSDDPNQEIGLGYDDIATSTSSVLRFVKIII